MEVSFSSSFKKAFKKRITNKNQETDFWKLMEATLDKVQNERGEELKAEMEKQEALQEELKASKVEALADLAKKFSEVASDAGEVIKRRGRPKKETA